MTLIILMAPQSVCAVHPFESSIKKLNEEPNDTRSYSGKHCCTSIFFFLLDCHTAELGEKACSQTVLEQELMW